MDELAVLRGVCMGLPAVEERMSHGEPAGFAAGKRLFATLADHHHDDRLAFLCAADPGERDALVASAPDRFFVRPYVGHRGWLGMWLDVPFDAHELREVVVDAYRLVAPKRLLAQL
jgi:hypothetical protein